MTKTQRVRDPVHGLIAFRAESSLDQLAWDLLDTPEFQRLRRIRQLGVSEYVFPSATHTRFAHSIGVFETARTLVEIIKREIAGIAQEFDQEKADVAVIAALLHDVGHGPFSHTFEGVQRSRGIRKEHEDWTAEIIRNPDGRVRSLLEAYRGGFAEAVAGIFDSDDPTDIYDAVVSSSFDADRLDYLRRDRLMTGTGAGAIDFDWLMEQIRVGEIEIDAADPEAGDLDDRTRVPTFCLDPKALPAAEQFLLARYTLTEQVYLHKTTRCVERMIALLLRRLADLAESEPDRTGLPVDHPLVRFLQPEGGTLQNYLALDDLVVSAAFERVAEGGDPMATELARRLRERRLYKALDLRVFGSDEGRQQRAARRIDGDIEAGRYASTVIKDETAVFSMYTPIGGDDERAHKKLHILDEAEGPLEITRVSNVVRTLAQGKRQLTRYYFENDSDRERARTGRRVA